MDNSIKNLNNIYKNSTIFITGGTGFIGKVTLEKILRLFPDISKIYLLIRNNNKNNYKERYNILINNTIFNKISEETKKKMSESRKEYWKNKRNDS